GDGRLAERGRPEAAAPAGVLPTEHPGGGGWPHPARGRGEPGGRAVRCGGDGGADAAAGGAGGGRAARGARRARDVADARGVRRPDLRARRPAALCTGAAVERVRRRDELAALPARARGAGPRLRGVFVPVVLFGFGSGRRVRGYTP